MSKRVYRQKKNSVLLERKIISRVSRDGTAFIYERYEDGHREYISALLDLDKHLFYCYCCCSTVSIAVGVIWSL